MIGLVLVSLKTKVYLYKKITDHHKQKS